MAKIKLTRLAKIDLTNIWNYTDDTWGSAQADRCLKDIEQQFQNLLLEPEKGKLRNEIRQDYRSIFTKKHVIFYRYHKSCIEIVRILYQRMDVNAHFPSLSGAA